MNKKIMVFTLIFIFVQHGFGMILPSMKQWQLKKLSQQLRDKQCVCENLEIELKPTDAECKETAQRYFENFISNSLKKNSEEFNTKKIREQQAIVKYDRAMLATIAGLPEEIQVEIISRMFEQDKKAAELFIIMPVEEALIEYGDLPRWENKIKLPSGMIFRLNSDEKRVLTKIFEDQTLHTGCNDEDVLKKMPGDIVYEVGKQYGTIYVNKQGLQLFMASLKASYQVLSDLKHVLPIAGLSWLAFLTTIEYVFGLNVTHIERYMFSLEMPIGIYFGIYFFTIINKDSMVCYQKEKIEKTITIASILERIHYRSTRNQ